MVGSEPTYGARGSVTVAIIVLVVVVVIAPVIVYLVYNMTSTIQNYAQGLSHKTRELRREKKRSDALLYQMLPKSVALQLKLGKRVSAEQYNSVTIFFSDLCGFTALSARSTPMQVVEFLNKLYYFYDTTIERFDVYKVETIGDAYMVASGVPQRNGSRHVGEISMLAMELLEGIRVFRIPHMPNENLRMRIGLHTGPVVAGVVGSKMPRYCLFGDTVHIASKMESMGVPMKIQISDHCKEALDVFGGFSTERREGTVQVKPGADGALETWFLTGKLSVSKTGSLVSTDNSQLPMLSALRSTYT